MIYHYIYNIIKIAFFDFSKFKITASAQLWEQATLIERVELREIVLFCSLGHGTLVPGGGKCFNKKISNYFFLKQNRVKSSEL